VEPIAEAELPVMVMFVMELELAISCCRCFCTNDGSRSSLDSGGGSSLVVVTVPPAVGAGFWGVAIQNPAARVGDFGSGTVASVDGEITR